MELQTDYWRKQLSMLGAQAEELRTLSTQVTTDVTAPITAQVKRGMDELHKATYKKPAISIGPFTVLVSSAGLVEHRYGLIAHFQVGVRKIGTRSKESSCHRIEHAAKLP